MKNILFMLFFAFATIASAQTEHMKFKGIPIDGPVDEFVQKLVQAGFTYVSTTDDGSAYLRGDFAGYKDCVLIVSIKNEKVFGVSVGLVQNDTWGLLESTYTTVKSMLTQKYGQPATCDENFKLYPISDSVKFAYLEQGNGKWSSMFRPSNGHVYLSIVPMSSSEGAVLLIYYDGAGSQEAIDQAMDDL